MRTFIVAIVFGLEITHNFIHTDGFITGGLAAIGIMLCIFQDFNELFGHKFKS